MSKFDGKVVMITGGARGQGRSHAVKFAEEGADVAICDIASQLDSVHYPMGSKEDLAETARLVEGVGRRCLPVQADIRDATQVEAFAEQVRAEFGRIDFLLANAAITTFGTVADMPDQTWQEMIDTNLTGTFHSIRAVLPTMIAQGSGRIVATASMGAKKGMPNLGHYVATKWGVIGLVKTVALEVGVHGITANVVCPGSVSTPMVHNRETYELFLPGKANPTTEDVAPAFAAMNALPVPWVESIDISNAMVFLCSDEARYITGETISVAAGQNASNAS